MSYTFALLLAVFIVTIGCQQHAVKNTTAATPEATASLSGTVTYRPRVALPPDAVVRVWVEDVSKADAAAPVIAETTFKSEGRQVPLPFTLTYPEADLAEGGRYALRATIHVGDRIAFTSTTATPIQLDTKEPIEIVLQPTSASVPPPGPTTLDLMPLENTYWKLTHVAGHPAVAVDGFRGAHLVFQTKDNRVSGNGGVNGIGGTYTLQGQSLRVERGFSTLMAGPEPLMEQESRLRDALEQTDGYRVTGKTLELLAGDKVLARFEAKPR